MLTTTKEFSGRVALELQDSAGLIKRVQDLISDDSSLAKNSETIVEELQSLDLVHQVLVDLSSIFLALSERPQSDADAPISKSIIDLAVQVSLRNKLSGLSEMNSGTTIDLF